MKRRTTTEPQRATLSRSMSARHPWRRTGVIATMAIWVLGATACTSSRFDFSQAVETGTWRDPNMSAAVRVSAGAGAIDVTVENVPLDEPVVLVGLLLADRTGEMPKYPAAARYVPTRSGVARTRFSNVPAGRYAAIAALSEDGVLEVDPGGFVLAPHGWSRDAVVGDGASIFEVLPGAAVELTIELVR